MSFRRNPQVWDNDTVADDEASRTVVVGSAPYVTVMVENHTASPTTITIEVGAKDDLSPGRNKEPEQWFPYLGAVDVAVAASSKIAVDLSPFGPLALRIVNTSGGARDLSAWVAMSSGHR